MNTLARIRGGQYLAGLGGIVLVLSLFLDWYVIGLPPLLSSLSSLGGNAWEAFASADIALLACGVAALCATLVAGGVVPTLRPNHDSLARLSKLVGMVAAGIVLVKMFDQPDPSEVWKLASGTYIALGAALAIALGGSAASRRS